MDPGRKSQAWRMALIMWVWLYDNLPLLLQLFVFLLC